MSFCQIHFWKTIPGHASSHGLISRHASTATAVVFVHGFMGDPIETWDGFSTRVDDVRSGLEWWATTDLFFFAYPSAETMISSASQQLLKFLADLIPTPPRNLFTSPPRYAEIDSSLESIHGWPRRSSLNYEQLVLVGHSQGAVVIRKAISEAVNICENSAANQGVSIFDYLSDAPFYNTLLNACLRLFSPAHGGMGGLLDAFRELPLSWLFDTFLRAESPSYSELRSASRVVLDLRRRTEEQWKKYELPALKASAIFPEADTVVSDLRFDHDSVSGYIAGQNHISICKPRTGYDRPLDFVRYGQPISLSAT